MKFGFIGTGNMAVAIIKGIIDKGYTAAANIYCTDVRQDKLLSFAEENGVNACASNEALIAASDVVILAVKPNIIPTLLPGLREELIEKKPLLVSIAAGTSLQMMEDLLHTDAAMPIVRVMPNVNALIGLGCAAVCGNSHATEDQVQCILDLFESVGAAYSIPEKDFSAYSAIASCSPAYTYLFIDALSRGGVKHGIPKNLATQIAAQAVLGSAQMVLEGIDSPWNLIDRVCSPGGTTVEAIVALEDGAFLPTVIKAVDAAVKKDRDLMKK